jgi:hypothetical protein
VRVDTAGTLPAPREVPGERLCLSLNEPRVDTLPAPAMLEL